VTVAPLSERGAGQVKVTFVVKDDSETFTLPRVDGMKATSTE